MHHPDICNILLIIEDYFLLRDDNPPIYQLDSIISTGNNSQVKLGIKIKRKLFNGYIHAEISALNRDDDAMRLTYVSDSNPNGWVKYFDIENNEYSEKTVRSIVKQILIMDKQSNYD